MTKTFRLHLPNIVIWSIIFYIKVMGINRIEPFNGYYDAHLSSILIQHRMNV